jgi:hypothetical protein
MSVRKMNEAARPDAVYFVDSSMVDAYAQAVSMSTKPARNIV